MRASFFFFFFLSSCCVGLDVADSPAVRCIVSGVCGSGTICGATAVNGYVVTNAHVAGTEVGRLVNVDFVSGGQKKTASGRVVWAAFSSTRLIDAAILEVPGLSAVSYLPMLKVRPFDPPFATRGAPRCVWPLVLKGFSNPEISDSTPLLRGDPDAIGGQSGSSIFNSTGSMVGLLTWSWGGRCAGQQTRSLWAVVNEQSLLGVPGRPEGLLEVQSGERSVTSDGIFSFVSTLPATLPIWVVPAAPVPPPPSCRELSDREWAIVQLIRSRDVAKSIDWVRLIELILQIVALFR